MHLKQRLKYFVKPLTQTLGLFCFSLLVTLVLFTHSSQTFASFAVFYYLNIEMLKMYHEQKIVVPYTVLEHTV